MVKLGSLSQTWGECSGCLFESGYWVSSRRFGFDVVCCGRVVVSATRCGCFGFVFVCLGVCGGLRDGLCKWVGWCRADCILFVKRNPLTYFTCYVVIIL